MNRYRRIFLATCFLACSFGVSAQDTITFEWAVSASKTFVIQASNGESFTVHWGDGSSNSYTGAGSSSITPNHTYAVADDYTVVVAAGSMDCRFTLLNCNSISNLDVSNCTALQSLICGDNFLSSLDVSNNTALQTLYCYDNSLSSLDVSNNTALQILYCYDNSLSSLDVRNCTALVNLRCNNNSLSSLDVSNCMALQTLYCNNNSLSSLDVSNCTVLEGLNCYTNSLSSLDVSNCTALQTLYCYDNFLISLDVSNCTALQGLYCYNNSLSSLDVSNCTALQQLNCYNNSLSSLDVSNCTALRYLQCYYNSLGSLDASNCTALQSLQCYTNHLPLSELYAASKVISTINSKQLGQQTLFPQIVEVGNAVDFSTQAKFGNPDTITVFVVTLNGSPASASDYTETDGVFTFHTTGNYTITMTNEAIKSSASYPAKVSVDITVPKANADASLSNLTISDGALTPSFSPTAYLYMAEVDNSVSSIILTATPTDPNASVTGAGTQSLAVGGNPFTITVTAEDGTTTKDYFVIVTRSTVGIDEVGTGGAASVRIYPNPTTGKFMIGDLRLDDLQLEIYDVVGNLLQSKIVNQQSKIVIDISHLSAGIYFLKIQTDDETVMKKVVKE